MSDTQWYAVRCCCTPQKIFGFLNLPMNIRMARVRLKSGELVEVQIKQSCRASVQFAPSSLSPEIDHIEQHYEMAIYSEERPIQFWREVEGFMEVV